MTDSRVLSDLEDPPESTVAHHPWTRAHGAKHRDFSASRLQTRERARQRVQRAIEEERVRAREQAESWRSTEFRDAIDAAARTLQAALAEPDTLESSAPVEQEVAQSQPDPESATLSPAVETSSQLHSDASVALSADPPQPGSPAAEAAAAQYFWAEAAELATPAWLGTDAAGLSAYPELHAPADTMQGARDRMASRWYALNEMTEIVPAPAETQPSPAARSVTPVPVLAVFSLAGGVGKSSLAATLARNLAARGERVLLVETASFAVLPFYFGARDRRTGVLRTFAPPEAGCCDAPVQMIAIDVDSLPAESAENDPLADEIVGCAQGASRIIVDIATASTAVARRLLRLSPQVLVPLVPDMNSVVNAGSTDSFFQIDGDSSVSSSEVCYVLNQFDPSLPLHLDVREVLRDRLGARLLPFTLRRAAAVSEALAEGMTVVDYAPDSPVAEDFNSLAVWVRACTSSAGAMRRPARWIEK